MKRETRDRVSSVARRTGLTADALIHSALAVYEREMFWQAWEDAHGRADPAEREADERETAVFDSASDRDYRTAEHIGPS